MADPENISKTVMDRRFLKYDITDRKRRKLPKR